MGAGIHKFRETEMSTSTTATNPFYSAATTAAQTQQTTQEPARNLDKDAFLKLLVAQIKNQDPLKPSDGAQFLAQLAQFSQLEQLMEIKDQLTALAQQQTPIQTTPAQSNGGQ